ncbi:MAG: hypothetical protein ACRDJW_12975 [Thermomicrobiales bacterium]
MPTSSRKETFGRRRSRPRTRRFGLAAVFLTLALLLAGPAGTLALLQSAVSGPSPAQGHAQVVAHGVAPMPAAQIAWRVVQDTAEPNEEAQPEVRALGFALADEDAIVVNDLTYGTQTRLAPGEASFVLDGVTQHRASLTDGSVPYYRIALVPVEQAGDAGGDSLLYAGDGFGAPDGNHDLNLVRDVLTTGESTAMSDSGFPTLVLATAGEIEVEVSGDTVTLAAGEAAEYSGNLTITGNSDGEAAFVAAVIGPAVPAPPRFSGTIALGLYTCPDGVTADDLIGGAADLDACEPLENAEDAGYDGVLMTPDGDEIPFADTIPGTRGATGLYVWQNLTFGEYTIPQPTSLPEGYGQAVYFDADLNLMETGGVTISRDNPDARVNLYLAASATASITVRVYNCPPPMTPDTLAGDFCEAAEGEFQVEVTGADDLLLDLSDATADGNAFTWAGLPLGDDGEATFEVAETVLPAGYTTYLIVGGRVGEPNTPYETMLDAKTDADLSIYNFQDAAGGGSIDITGYLCPTAESSAEECQANGSIALTDVIIATSISGDVLTSATAEQSDDTYSWPIVPFATYTIDPASIVPAGYELVAVGGADVDDAGYVFELSAESPSASVGVYLVAEGGEEPEPPVDSDGDGLSDEDEVALGTDPLNPDSDGDCHSDGAEVTAGTNPLDANSFPDGECDVAV